MTALLGGEVFGHLGCCANERPYVLPLAYVFQDDVIYGQTTEGKKVETLRQNPNVCFQVQRQEPGQWQSVICWGRYEELDLEKIKTLELTAIVEELAKTIAAIQRDVGILIPFSFEDGTITALAENGRKSTLFRIVVTEKTGRLYQATV